MMIRMRAAEHTDEVVGVIQRDESPTREQL